MKNLKYIILFFAVISFASCEDYFGADSNVDPDNPTSSTVNVLLPPIQVELSYLYGGDFTRYNGLYTQHVDGVGRQFVVLNNYGMVPSDVDNAWSDIYVGVFNACRQLTKIADEGGLNHYKGISLVLESYALMMATDVWGDIPYSDALKFGEQGLYSPTFDTQESIYASIFENLGMARTLLSGDDGGSAPGTDDLVYGGDASKWLKFINVLEARGKIHLSKVNGNTAYSDAMAALMGGAFESSADDGGVAYGPAATANAPWYQYIEQRDDCETGASYVALLTSMNDPRLATYGFEHAVPDHPVFTPDQTVNLLTFTEQEFIRAESMMALGNGTGAYDAVLSGVTSSMAEAGVTGDVAAYLSDNGINSTNISMTDIMMQKYIALYTSPEVFNDWRRSGVPSLSPNSGSEIPRRWWYAESEQFSNTNTPSPSSYTIYDRVWWDN